jgi:hypothetical protein
MFVKPEEQLETQAPFWKNPLLQVHTPLTGEDPLGQEVVQLVFNKLNPLRQAEQTWYEEHLVHG